MLQVKDLSFSYGKTEVIHGISFDVKPGEIVTIIGANGAGKSTTLNTIVGLQRANSGSIIYKGTDISKTKPQHLVKMGIRLVPEGRQIFPAHTVEENLLLGAHTESDNNKIAERVKEMYHRFPRLKERNKQWAGTLSGGEQQMLAIARALMTKPELLILDEPSLGLAPIIVADVFKLLKEISNTGMTILLVEQMANSALKISDRAFVLETGKIILSGDSETVSSDPKVIEAYLGSK
ncbi:ABC transporter ATP-binding protein [Tissierella sp.]|uniref:ABC transporter ATP-binding protein n=1 Tax=Tissierella sp. TaxID=41274 RepID=UPI0028630076|nr:ABC transporter ATP-binding protein [Tissierella sp.]MDR7855333.1 ABC transporter ATP-binding protein [Tissierella sp.]